MQVLVVSRGLKRQGAVLGAPPSLLLLLLPPFAFFVNIFLNYKFCCVPLVFIFIA